MAAKALRLPTDAFVRNIATHNKLFHDQFGEAYLAVGGNGSEIYRIHSRECTAWLNMQSYQNYHVILKNNQATDIKRALEGIAIYDKGNEIMLEPRLRKIDNEIWYDLGKAAVRINEKDWQIVEEPPIMFRRYNHQKPQIMPKRGGSIQLFRKFTNITKEKDWYMFLAFAISTLIPDIPKPILVINGSQGAGKSTPMRMLKELADPSRLVSAGKITGEIELARLANRHSLLFFDNLSFLEKDNSDILCRLITGDGFSKRKLYSDDDEIIYNFKRPLMLNGINNFITQADLLDRAIIINIERIPEEKRLTELELWSKFEEEKPLILGAMFTVLSKAMKIFPQTPTSGLPRMADFGRWGCAIYSAIKNEPFDEFQAILSDNKVRQIEESIEADPVAQLAKFVAERFIRCQGTAADFYDAIDNICILNMPKEIYHLRDRVNWPKDLSQIGKRLRKAEGTLRESGIKIEFKVENNERCIYFTDTKVPYPEAVNVHRLGCSEDYEKTRKDNVLAYLSPEEREGEIKNQAFGILLKRRKYSHSLRPDSKDLAQFKARVKYIKQHSIFESSHLSMKEGSKNQLEESKKERLNKTLEGCQQHEIDSTNLSELNEI